MTSSLVPFCFNANVTAALTSSLINFVTQSRAFQSLSHTFPITLHCDCSCEGIAIL